MTRAGLAPNVRPRRYILRPVTTPSTGRAYLDEVLDQPGSVLAFAHRGGAYHPEIEGLENTLEAFQHAVQLGYTHLETDVHVTADGALLAFHDDVLDRVTDRKGPIGSLRLAEVREARIGGRAEIPALADLWDALPGCRFNVDLKSDGAVRPLADFISARQAHDRILVGSFSHRRVREFRRLTEGRVATAASSVEIVAAITAPHLAAARAVVAGADAFQVPHRRRGVPVATRHLVERAHRLGMHVHVWTIDRPEEMRELLDRGVDGLFTDRTDTLKSVLRERGQWRETT